MAAFVYIGAPTAQECVRRWQDDNGKWHVRTRPGGAVGDGPASTSCYGLTFYRDRPTEVPDNYVVPGTRDPVLGAEFVLRKLRNNGHFKEVIETPDPKVTIEPAPAKKRGRPRKKLTAAKGTVGVAATGTLSAADG